VVRNFRIACDNRSRQHLTLLQSMNIRQKKAPDVSKVVWKRIGEVVRNFRIACDNRSQ
jgi:hypothetical protein